MTLIEQCFNYILIILIFVYLLIVIHVYDLFCKCRVATINPESIRTLCFLTTLLEMLHVFSLCVVSELLHT